jgi:4-hydroxy-tetrahydrodipicolinate reductase
MNLLVLGRGKTGSLVAEVAAGRGHQVRSLASRDNPDASALTRELLSTFDVAVDFTTPAAAPRNISACVAAGTPVVVGTTGWYAELPRIRSMVEQSGGALVCASNFSVGVNLFYEIARLASAALHHGYFGHIFERHHVHKKDAPSGTALVLQQILRESGGDEVEITAFREGEVVGMHELELDSSADCLWLAHEAKSRFGFAEGAVRAAEWLQGRNGFFDFRDVWRDLPR